MTLTGGHNVTISTFIISQPTRETPDWHDRNIFDTKAERQCHLDH